MVLEKENSVVKRFDTFIASFSTAIN